MRSVLLTGASLVLTAMVIGNAYYQRQQFYPSVVYITKSNASMAVIYVQAFVFVILLGKLMRKIFFGNLRAAEFEHLMERSWYAVTETCLAFTVFKDDFSPKFVALFTLLLFLKSFHWLAEDRVDFMERSPSISFLFHVRVITLAFLLAALDVHFIIHAYQSTLTKGASVQLVFGFEYAVLLTIIANTLVKYVLHSIDLHSDNPWDNKAVFMLYTELAIGFVKVLLYVLFVIIMVRIYTLPLFAVRPMYLTMRAFKKAFNDVILSRRAIHNMNTWYPDATAEELANTDNVCIICREEMLAPTTKKLPCNHIFHKSCLRSWFQRQQTCPTCRLDVLRAPVNAVHGRGRPAQTQQPAAGQHQQAAGGQQAPQAQQAGAMPPPFIPIFDPNFFAQLAAAAGNNIRPPAAGAQQATSPGRPAAPQFMAPPFFPPFPPMFNLPPPPMPPPNFAGLTDAELAALEGTERQNVEARIKVLRNIQVLLDAAVMEMNQYTAVVSRLNTTTNNVPSSTAGATTTATTSSSNAAATASTSPTTISTGARPKTAVSTLETSNTAPNTERDEDELIRRMDGNGNSTGDNNIGAAASSSSALSPEQMEIRRRRLEKFDTTKTTDSS